MKYRMVLALFLTVCIVLLAACGGSTNSSSASSAPSGVQEVRVTVTDTGIESSLTTFLAAHSYSFVVTNKGHASHDFVIRMPVQGPALGTQPNHGILYQINASQLPPGATKTFIFQFPVTSPQSHFQFDSGTLSQTGARILLPIEVK